jgi:acylphosphatase
LDDGAVEVVAEGDEESLEQFVVWCRIGRPRHVTRVEVARAAATGEFAGFDVD